MSLNDRIRQDNEILRKIKREIIKCAKRGDLHYYWDISGIGDSTVKGIILELEKEGKMVKSKGMNYKIIRW
jgi:Holliday junction resolvasome RuvABC DNA-binding subunit